MIQLQVLLDPSVAPVFDGHRLDIDGLTGVIVTAQQPDGSRSQDWIRELRRHSILSAAGQSPILTQAEEKLNRWWTELSQSRAPLQEHSYFESHVVPAAESALEGTLLLAALNPLQEESLLARERRQLGLIDYLSLPVALRDAHEGSLPIVLRAMAICRVLNVEEVERQRMFSRDGARDAILRRLCVAGALMLCTLAVSPGYGLLPMLFTLTLWLAGAYAVDMILGLKPRIGAGSVMAYGALLVSLVHWWGPPLTNDVEPTILVLVPVHVAGAYLCGRLLEWLLRRQMPRRAHSFAWLRWNWRAGDFPIYAYILPLIAVLAVGQVYVAAYLGLDPAAMVDLIYPDFLTDMLLPASLGMWTQVASNLLFGLAWFLMATTAVPWLRLSPLLCGIGLIIVNLLAILAIVASIVFLPFGLLWGLLVIPAGIGFILLERTLWDE